MNKTTSIFEFVKHHRQRIASVYIALNIAGFFAWNQIANSDSISWNATEALFMISNLIMIGLFFSRREYKSIDKSVFRQSIAAIAFFSGLAFSGQPETGSDAMKDISFGILIAAHLLGIISLFNLGKSFGVLIANRKIKTGGIYSIVRHPMYVTDLLFRIGYVVSHFNLFAATLLLLSGACYVYRALLEERFLAADQDYADYMKKVKYRFIPYIY